MNKKIKQVFYVIGHVDMPIGEFIDCFYNGDYYNTREQAEEAREKCIKNDKEALGEDFTENDLEYYDVIKVTLDIKKD